MRLRNAVLAAFVAIGAAGSLRAQARDQVLAAAQAYEEGRFADSSALLTRAIGSGELSGDQLAEAHWNRGLAYERSGNREGAISDFQAFASLSPSDSDGPAKIVEIGVQLRRYADAAKAIDVMFDRFPARVRERKWELVEIARDLQLRGQWAGAETLLGKYGTIEAEDPTINFSRARTAAVLGRRGEALDLLRRSASQHNLVLFRADKAFSALWDDQEFLSTADIRAMYERDLASAEAAAEGDRESLFPIVLRMSALWRLGRFDEAAELGETTRSSDLTRFKDLDYREAQLYEQLARSLEMKGDLAGAERIFRAGVDRLADKTETVVTLMMSAGQFLATTMNKYGDALQMADRADRLARQIYGPGIGDSVRALAYWGLKRQTEFDRIVEYAERNISESQSIAVDLYLLTNRRDDAARLVAKQLADPARVDVMLVALQRYKKNRAPIGTIEKTLEREWDALRAHPLVLEAVRQVGRVTEIEAANRY